MAFLNEQGLHGDTHRVWLSSPNAGAEDNVLNQCDLAANRCDLSPAIQAYLADASAVSDSVLVNLNPTDFVEGRRPVEELRPLLELVLSTVKDRYPRVRHVEAFNEPDAYAADRDPHKRLDFLSYHSYLAWDDAYQVPTLYKDDLTVVTSDRTTIEGWLRERRLRRSIPAYVTETGIYPGPAFDDTDPGPDYLRQAAGLATFGYLYGNQRDTVMFNWCVRHRVEERKDQLVTRTPGGPLTDTFTPYGNMLLMQSRMEDERVAAEVDGPILDGDNGVYAVASSGRDGASVMVWNWQHVHGESYRATIDMERLPARLRHGQVRQQLFRIDETTSNHVADPATADLQLVDESVVRPGRSHDVTVDLDPNAIYLVVLEPA